MNTSKIIKLAFMAIILLINHHFVLAKSWSTAPKQNTQQQNNVTTTQSPMKLCRTQVNGQIEVGMIINDRECLIYKQGQPTLLKHYTTINQPAHSDFSDTSLSCQTLWQNGIDIKQMNPNLATCYFQLNQVISKNSLATQKPINLLVFYDAIEEKTSNKSLKYNQLIDELQPLKINLSLVKLTGTCQNIQLKFINFGQFKKQSDQQYWSDLVKFNQPQSNSKISLTSKSSKYYGTSQKNVPHQNMMVALSQNNSHCSHFSDLLNLVSTGNQAITPHKSALKQGYGTQTTNNKIVHIARHHHATVYDINHFKTLEKRLNDGYETLEMQGLMGTFGKKQPIKKSNKKPPHPTSLMHKTLGDFDDQY
ncbi:MAG: hypothetical protein HON94_06320 [Methylococcales bacterium]|nr:hypothetical protein [Methylococcales bacterium]MBT7410795.1 hypothetical protein [Methylococcales bacterium]